MFELARTANAARIPLRVKAFHHVHMRFTPLLSILKAALKEMPTRPVVLVHGCLHEGVQAFKPTIDALAATHAALKIHYRYSEPAPADVTRDSSSSTGFVNAELLESLVPDRNADYYFCGPKPFMVNIYHQLLGWGIPASQVHFEFFGPRQELAESPSEHAA